MPLYLHQQPDWPSFRWNSEKLLPLISLVRNRQGRLLGKMSATGFDIRAEANLEILTADVLKSGEIEGEYFNREQVRSSLARRLGLEISGLVPSDRNTDGMVDLMLDATSNFEKPLTQSRLFDWHTWLFPDGKSGVYTVLKGQWRDDSTGPMQVVSGALGKEKVHFEAPSAKSLPYETGLFIDWMNSETETELLLKAGIAHLWFITIHPFEDGNGRIARAISDMLLARSDEQFFRFYSMSTQIRKERSSYYLMLEKTQKGGLDITEWLEWFLLCLLRAIESSDSILGKTRFKHAFWLRHAQTIFNERQKKILDRLLSDFEGNLNTSKWAKIARCSQDTALRDIQDLVAKNVLVKTERSGRSTAYNLVEPEEGAF